MPTFSPYFLSLTRLAEILPPESFLDLGRYGNVASIPTNALQVVRLMSSLGTAIETWLVEKNLPTIGELLATRNVASGQFFTHYGPFFGRGVIDASIRFQTQKPVKTTPLLRADLSNFLDGLWLEMQAHPENYTTVSAVGEMSGGKRLFVIARIDDSTDGLISARLYAAGQLHNVERKKPALGDTFGRLPYQMEVFLLQVDAFKDAWESPSPTKKQLSALLKIPEKDIKEAFAQILGEPFVPKDWGGERSDLVTTRVTLEGKPVATAFAFKGPAVPKPLTVADLGKNGDQISRLFTEPVDFVVLQHCHQIRRRFAII